MSRTPIKQTIRTLYLAADDESRRRLNQMIYEAIYIGEAEVIKNVINEPYDSLYVGQEAYEAIAREEHADAVEAHIRHSWRDSSQRVTAPADGGDAGN